MTTTRKKAADELSSIIRDFGDMTDIGDTQGAAAAAPAQATPTPTSTESPSTRPKPPKKAKHPCGKCDAEVTGNSVCCNSCELWFHSGCVDGMSKDYFDNCKKMYELYGHSAFLCKVCRKVWTAMKKSIKELKDDMKGMADKIVVLEMEKEALAQKLERIEMKAEKVSDRVVGVEKEVATGMEKAKEEVKNDVKTEMALREEKGSNVVLYGVEETKEEDTEQWKAKEKQKVEDVFRHMGVETQGEFTIKYRAGRPRPEGAKARPVIINVADDEVRVNILRNAPKLARKEETKRIYIAQDLTQQQQAEDRKNEIKLKEEASKKMEEEKNGGGGRKWIVVGGRGRRRIIGVVVREMENQ